MSDADHDRFGDEHLRVPWAHSDGVVPRRVLRPLQEFLDTATAGAVLLLIAVVIALVWVNSPWGEGYFAFWETHLEIGVGSVVIDKDLHFWVNEGLMTLFFLLVGMEIKREFMSGELRDRRKAVLPMLAAVGGMAVPALIYLAIAGGEVASGWGVPMATDIAFALGVLTLAAAHAPPSLKPLLLTLAIVDDIGAILVIALFYSTGVDFEALFAALLVCAAISVSVRIHIRANAWYVLLGVALWYATYLAGIHPTIAGVALGLLTPAVAFQRPARVSEEARRVAEETSDDPADADADSGQWLRLATLSREAVSPLARVEHALLPWSSFVIVPLFALANAGIELSTATISAALTSAVALGIFFGLVIGKPVGVLVASATAVRSGMARLGRGVGWGDLTGMGITAGVGFTMALFIAELAFEDPQLLDEAKLAILAASVVAGAAGYAMLRISPNPLDGPGTEADDDTGVSSSAGPSSPAD